MRQYYIAVLTIYTATVFAADSINYKQAELHRVTGQIQQLQINITQDRQQQSDLEQKLKTSEIGIGKLSQQISSFNIAIAKEQQQLAKLKSSRQVTQNKLNKQNQALAQQLCAAFKLGQMQPLKIILNQQNPNTIQRHMNYYRYLSQARLELIEKINESLTTIKVNMQSIAQHQQNLKKLLFRNQQQQNQLQTAQKMRQQLINQFHQRVQNKEQRLASLLANQKALQDIITHLQIQTEIGITGKPFNELQGKLRWPVKGSLAARYGSTLDVGGDQHLAGVIIKAAQGTPVQAISSGQIIFANWLRGFGLLIIIKHSNNYMSLYARNHALHVKVGDRVNTGDIIATIGNSGGFEKAGLYFEVRQNGNPVNPGLWCR